MCLHAVCSTSVGQYVYVSTDALRLQIDTEWSKCGQRSGQLQELLESLEGRSGAAARQRAEAKPCSEGLYLNALSCLGETHP